MTADCRRGCAALAHRGGVVGEMLKKRRCLQPAGENRRRGRSVAMLASAVLAPVAEMDTRGEAQRYPHAECSRQGCAGSRLAAASEFVPSPGQRTIDIMPAQAHQGGRVVSAAIAQHHGRCTGNPPPGIRDARHRRRTHPAPPRSPPPPRDWQCSCTRRTAAIGLFVHDVGAGIGWSCHVDRQHDQRWALLESHSVAPGTTLARALR